MENEKIAEFAYDVHTALGAYDTPHLDHLKIMGMAATLAVHIRGLGEIEYEVLKQVSFYYFKIPSFALREVLLLLEEVEFVQILSKGKNINAIIPKVPHFKSIYEIIGGHAQDGDLNEHEQVMLAMLGELYEKPENKSKLINGLGAEMNVFNQCFTYCEAGGLIRVHKARGKEIAVSPFYFADNLEGLADLAAKSGAGGIKSVVEVVKKNQGWPLSLIKNTGVIGSVSLDKDAIGLIEAMSSEGILKPPSIKFSGGAEQFIFTPSPGSQRLSPANREIYERAMALISCVRKGQLLPDNYKIKMPLLLLQRFKERGYLKSNTEARDQYKNLVFLKVARLIPTGGGWYRLDLIQTEENVQALNMAINLLSNGDLSGMEVNKEAQLAFSKDEQYIQSIVSSAEMRKIGQLQMSEKAKFEMEQMLLRLDS